MAGTCLPSRASTAAGRISAGKARTAALFKKPTRAFEEIIGKGRTAMIALEDFTPLEGGIPLTVDGQIVGAVGVSGAASAQQDEELAVVAAGAAAGAGLPAGGAAAAAVPAPRGRRREGAARGGEHGVGAPAPGPGGAGLRAGGGERGGGGARPRPRRYSHWTARCDRRSRLEGRCGPGRRELEVPRRDARR